MQGQKAAATSTTFDIHVVETRTEALQQANTKAVELQWTAEETREAGRRAPFLVLIYTQNFLVLGYQEIDFQL